MCRRATRTDNEVQISLVQAHNARDWASGAPVLTPNYPADYGTDQTCTVHQEYHRQPLEDDIVDACVWVYPTAHIIKLCVPPATLF